MTDVKRIRIPEEMMEAIRERARREHLDESTAIRQLVLMGLREYACQLYRDGEVSLRRAAGIAGLPPRDMLEHLRERGIGGNVTLAQQRAAVHHAREAVDDEG